MAWDGPFGMMTVIKDEGFWDPNDNPRLQSRICTLTRRRGKVLVEVCCLPAFVPG